MLRTCKKCGEIKEIEEFEVSNRYLYGRTFRCKLCKKKEAAKHYEINKDKICQSVKKYRDANKTKIRQHKKTYNKKYYFKNKIKFSSDDWKEKMRNYRYKNIEKYRLTDRKLDKTYRDKLTDKYIKGLFRSAGILKPSQELIQLKKIQLQLLRLTK